MKYEQCPQCGKQGWYRKYYYGWVERCRYCKFEIAHDSGGKA